MVVYSSLLKTRRILTSTYMSGSEGLFVLNKYIMNGCQNSGLNPIHSPVEPPFRGMYLRLLK